MILGRWCTVMSVSEAFVYYLWCPAALAPSSSRTLLPILDLTFQHLVPSPLFLFYSASLLR